ncbi:solute carrier family 12 member 9-like isoform X2 [Lingula anatina]|uniref:Solute carrier family 12 member 9 n=1 Tax=Lingula anatina TaxID=7574 RepID=A0A2R2MRR5_LINAN|nr:solute carrier family 12 member 9-like isoform X2 [Lingula anatina]|eukprot:XP_023932944.1 solute carrier family 12 member 9-like isoform X2 [Lingula anatina]
MSGKYGSVGNGVSYSKLNGSEDSVNFCSGATAPDTISNASGVFSSGHGYLRTNDSFGKSHKSDSTSVLIDPVGRHDEDDEPILPPSAGRVLGTLGGVFAPVALGQLSTNVFQRVGFVVGEAGMLQTLLMFVLAYTILLLTVLSICAISTNGAIEGGGAYYMISRALGPEFGGAIGLLFFFANVFSAALYVAGFVEGLLSNFGPGGTLNLDPPLPEDDINASFKGYSYLYATVVLIFCLIVCMIGGAMFARTSLFILMVVVLCTLMVIISTFVKQASELPIPIPIPRTNTLVYPDVSNVTENVTTVFYNYTGYSIHTFMENLFGKYTADYTNPKVIQNFAIVFAVLFSSVTGIMNGSNMSGELKDPSRSIPRGTLGAVSFTFTTYIILAFITAFTASGDLLRNNYGYLQEVNIWAPFVIIGIFAATLSAALGNLIGASRVLEALARDELFWFLLKPATIVTRSGNPWVAVIISWLLVQLVLLIGSLNAIAPLVSVFFLLSYAATNLACLALELASAPNFRPTFKYFFWWTSLLGMLGCLAMCFLINAVFAAVAVIILMLLVMVLHLRTWPTSWGSISQALIFHQVRKYLLLLDSRKEHVKFWRPQILLLVANPRSCINLIHFVNDLKKGGLYVLGHVKVGEFDQQKDDEVQQEYPGWLALIDSLKVKAFAEMTVAESVREGMRHLVYISGLGGMKPNTICLGFYDDSVPMDTLVHRRRRTRTFYGSAEEGSTDPVAEIFPPLRGIGDRKPLVAEEYVKLIADTLKMSKNIFICRHFQQLDKEAIIKSKNRKFIDVWPVNMFNPRTAGYLDMSCLFILQLACILNMVSGWKSKTTLRIFLCVEREGPDTERKQKKLEEILKQLRILGQIRAIPWTDAVIHHATSQQSAEETKLSTDYTVVSDEYVVKLNELIKQHSSNQGNTAVTFLYLPRTPKKESLYTKYLKQLAILTDDLPPTVLVHGIHPVTSTTL